MSRRRRRHADPAKLPRRDPGDREHKEEREKARRELTRVDESLARATAIMGAAIVYFGAWALNAFLGFFPPTTSLDLTHPLLLIGIASLVVSLFVARYLVRSLPTRRLITLGSWAALAFGVVVISFVGIFLAAAPTAEGAVTIAAGMGISWLMATLWVALLKRRAARLLTVVGE